MPWCGAQTAGQLREYLEAAYCGPITGELEHILDEERRLWLAQQLEERDSLYALSEEQRLRVVRLLHQSDVFEGFLQVKFRNLKRYALEGCEAMLPAVDELLRTAGCSDVIIGMPHRGRLNLLCSLLKFPPRTLFRKIQGESDVPDGVTCASGDVISHLAINTRLKYDSGHRVNVSLLHNPSHLEGVNPVALGRTHARQTLSGDDALCVQIHGDAAFALQGVNYESVQLSKLRNFSVGGTVHLIVNNQIGFTAEASTGRSSRYSSDLAKMMEFPVLRVNANEPEAVVQAMRIATSYRSRFRDDIFVDLIGFRRHGHNELDQPSYTNPQMYQKVDALKPIAHTFSERAASQGWLPSDFVQKERDRARAFLDAELNEANEGKPTKAIPHLEKKWVPFLARDGRAQGDPESTGLPAEELKQVGEASIRVPDDFTVHSRLQKVFLQARQKRLDSGQLDWALAEALSFGSLLKENYGVRLCGQDSGRGTFSQRHLAVTCQDSQRVVTPLQDAGPGRLQIINSPLAELAVLAFEYGWSVEDPNTLPIWEAQYGDFFNSAQVTIDTFVSCGEHKWQRPSAQVMLLPHGYDGAGPEHSSCRMERFLQMVGTTSLDMEMEEDSLAAINWRVLNPTTPANYFHLLRRQMLSSLRKPAIVVAPKTLLRHPEVVSSYDDVAVGTRFQPVLDDPRATGEETDIVFCTGKVYYELDHKADRAVIRLEELAPFPYREISAVLSRYPKAAKLTWFQEEPQNMGAYSYIYPRFSRFVVKTGMGLNYVGRPAMAAPAVGVGAQHKQQVKDLFDAMK